MFSVLRNTLLADMVPESASGRLAIDVGRRSVLRQAPAALLLGAGVAAADSTTPREARRSGPIESSFVDFPDELARFRAHMRFERDLRDTAETISWYHFTHYVVAPGSRPAPVVRFEGCEYSYQRRIGKQTWRVHGHNMSFPRDLQTGKYSDLAVNPITQETLQVAPMFLTGDPGLLQSPSGFLPLDRTNPQWIKPNVMFRIEGELIKMEQVRPIPENWPIMFIESSVASAPRRDFDNPTVTSLRYQTSGFYIFPFPKWMRMGDRPGHMLGAWSGRKLQGPQELPEDYRAHAENQRPDLLHAQWDLLDKPLPEPLRAAVI